MSLLLERLVPLKPFGLFRETGFIGRHHIEWMDKHNHTWDHGGWVITICTRCQIGWNDPRRYRMCRP